MRFFISVIVTGAMLAMLCGCGKSESGKSPKKPPVENPSEKTAEKREEKKKESPAPKKEVVKEVTKKETKKTALPEEIEKKSDEDDANESEARRLFKEILENQKNGEYNKAIPLAKDLMARLPDTQEAKDVIPIYREMNNYVRMRRELDFNYNMLTQDPFVRNRYAAEKFFIANKEMSEIYFGEILRKTRDEKEFRLLLKLMGKMKSTKNLGFLVAVLTNSSKPELEPDILNYINDVKDSKLKNVFKALFSKKDKPAEACRQLYVRMSDPDLVLMLGDILCNLIPEEEPDLLDRIKGAAELNDVDLVRELILINGTLNKKYEGNVIAYAMNLDQEKKSELTSMVDKISKNVQTGGERLKPYGTFLKNLMPRLFLYPKGVVAHYMLNGNGQDTSGQSHGKMSGMKPAMSMAGTPSDAVHFATSKSYIHVSHSTAIEMGKKGADFSITFWYKLLQKNNGSYLLILQKGKDTRQRTPAIWLLPSDTRLHFKISTTKHYSEGTNSKTPLPVNKWVHIAYVKENAYLKLYFNGKLDCTAKLAGTVISNTSGFRMGAQPFYPTPLAMMDDLVIFNRALTLEEIKLLFKKGVY